MFENIRNNITIWINDVKEICKTKVIEQNKITLSILIISVIAILVKVFAFYNLMNISANVGIIWLVTCMITGLIFIGNKNKWIAATIYLLFSTLIFTDAVYASFFNRYLSISVISQAGLLSGVQESVKQALDPKFFLLFVDNILIFVFLVVAKFDKKINRAPKDVLENLSTLHEKFTQKHANKIIAFVLIIFLFFVSTITGQEFYTYHVRDLFNTIYKGNEDTINKDSLILSTGSYENEKNGPLFGIAKGRNLIVIQVESFQNMVISKQYDGHDITPNITKLINDKSTIYFDNYYEERGSGNTSDAEFATNNSLYGTIESFTYKLYANNYFQGLPWQLKKLGYQTASFHGYKKDFWNRDLAYPAQGFDTFRSELDFKPSYILGMGIDDTEFFKQSTDYLKSMTQPFYGFLVTLSNHYPFYMPTRYIHIKLKPEDENTIFGNYINSVNHTDEAIGQFIDDLKAAGLYDNSIIAIYGDHFGLTPSDKQIYESISRFLGKPYDYDTMMNVPLLIHIPNENVNKRVSISGGQMDFLPTISYLLGIEKLDTLYFGHNLLTAKSGFVTEQAYMPRGSFIRDNVIFEMSKDGVFENSRAWNFKTGESVPLADCKEGYLRSKQTTELSEFYLKNDVLRKALLEKMTPAQIMKSLNMIEPPKRIAIAGAPNQLFAGTNSKEALELSYEKGNKYIKLDFTWNEAGSSQVIAKNGYTSMNMDDVSKFMTEHPDAYIIISQDKNIAYLLDGIAKKYPEIKDRIIPEMNLMEEYYLALANGFQNAIFKVKDASYSEKQILDFIEMNKVFATSIPEAMITDNIKAFVKKGKMIYKQSNFYDILL